MKDKSKKLLVINTNKKPSPAQSSAQSSGGTPYGGGFGGVAFDMSDYLLKAVWDRVWEIKTDSQENEYIFSKLPVVTQYGITMYADGGELNLPSIFEGLPFDNQTIWLNPETGVIEVIGGTGGGSIDSIHWNNIEGKPSFAAVATSGKYADLSEKPDLTKYALQSEIPSLSGYATEKWVTDKNYLDSTKLSDELAKYVTIDEDETINGVKDFTNGLMIDGLGITKLQDDVVYLDAHLVVRGGITMFGTGEDVDVPTIMDALSVDGVNLQVVNGVLTFVGETTGGVADSVRWDNVIGRPTLLSSFTDDVVAGKYLPLSGGTITGDVKIAATTAKPYGTTLHIARTPSVIHFWTADESESLGYLGFDTVDSPCMYGGNGANDSKKFLLHSGNYSSYALPLSGGTLSNSATGLFINRTTEGTNPHICFRSQGTNIGDIGINYDGTKPVWYNYNTKTWNDIITSDNAANYTVGNATKFNGYTMRTSNTWVDKSIDARVQYTINASALSSSNFYPILFSATPKDLYVCMYSQQGQSSAAYNQNKLEFTFRGQGWNDTPASLTVHNYNCYTAGEMTIGRIGMGKEGGHKVVWVRGGLTYYIISNITPSLKTANFTSGNEVYTVGTGLSGGTNTKVTTYWTPQTTSGLGTLYHSGSIYSGGGIQIDGGSRFKSDLTINGKLTVDGLATFNGGLTATTGTFNGGVNAQSYGGYNGNTAITSSYRWAIYQWNNELQITRRDNSNTYKGTMAGFDLTSGNVLFEAGITMYSDQRKKTILNHVELSLKQIADAPLIEHYYNSDESKTTHVGSIAQYWAEMNDWFCKKDNEGFYTMEIQNAALASAISIARELVKYESKTDKKIRLLKKRIGELEDEIEKLKTA